MVILTRAYTHGGWAHRQRVNIFDSSSFFGANQSLRRTIATSDNQSLLRRTIAMSDNQSLLRRTIAMSDNQSLIRRTIAMSDNQSLNRRTIDMSDNQSLRRTINCFVEQSLRPILSRFVRLLLPRTIASLDNRPFDNQSLRRTIAKLDNQSLRWTTATSV